MTNDALDPIILIIFGAAGDLTHRKLLPAMYNLYLEGFLPDQFAILGADLKDLGDDGFRERALDGVDTFSRAGDADEEIWKDFAQRLFFVPANVKETESYVHLAERLADLSRDWEKPAHHIFYLSTSPTLIDDIANGMGAAALLADPERSRLVVEKPFGRDLASALVLNDLLMDVAQESQIYRIDHYLGKETVQNILAFRFANVLFEPIWNRRYIDHVQITVAEQVGIGHRGGYYEHAGALRDMVQNHLLQVLCLTAMEPPVSFKANEIRSKKADVLRAIRPVDPDRVHEVAVRGQYGPGKIDGEQVPGYKEEPGVAPGSNTETYVALKLFVDNWRWQGVPFYLRTGKRLPIRDSEVVIQFQDVPHQTFPSNAAENWHSNRLVMHLQPDQGLALRFQAKRPGQQMNLRPADLSFSYRDNFHEPHPEAYETLLLNVIQGDPTLFMRADQVQAAWELLMPILNHWESVAPPVFPNYHAGTWGPVAADDLLTRDGHRWIQPTNMEV